jgi:hypothetical protein
MKGNFCERNLKPLTWNVLSFFIQTYSMLFIWQFINRWIEISQNTFIFPTRYFVMHVETDIHILKEAIFNIVILRKFTHPFRSISETTNNVNS